MEKIRLGDFLRTLSTESKHPNIITIFIHRLNNEFDTYDVDRVEINSEEFTRLFADDSFIKSININVYNIKIEVLKS